MRNAQLHIRSGFRAYPIVELGKNNDLTHVEVPFKSF